MASGGNAGGLLFDASSSYRLSFKSPSVLRLRPRNMVFAAHSRVADRTDIAFEGDRVGTI